MFLLDGKITNLALKFLRHVVALVVVLNSWPLVILFVVSFLLAVAHVIISFCITMHRRNLWLGAASVQHKLQYRYQGRTGLRMLRQEPLAEFTSGNPAYSRPPTLTWTLFTSANAIIKCTFLSPFPDHTLKIIYMKSDKWHKIQTSGKYMGFLGANTFLRSK